MTEYDEIRTSALPEPDGTHRVLGIRYGADYSYSTDYTVIGFITKRRYERIIFEGRERVHQLRQPLE